MSKAATAVVTAQTAVRAQRVLVVVPTYNEVQNIDSIVLPIVGRGWDVLIIDDNSPDGTGDRADVLAHMSSQVRVMHRPQKLGLGTAYVEGFKSGLLDGYDLFVEMDADGSHSPDDLARLISVAERTGGLAIGSRYVVGGETEGWSLQRRLLSRSSNWYCRIQLGRSVMDWTSGYRCFSAAALTAIDFDKVFSSGFSFQIELAFKCIRAGIPVAEVPITFRERAKGRSKASTTEVMMALRCVSALRSRVPTMAVSTSARLAVNGQGSSPSEKVAADSESRNLHPNSSGPIKASSPKRRRRHPLESAVVGILAYNEEETIERCIRSVLAQYEGIPSVRSVVVVASGCTDRTPQIVAAIAREDPRVRLVIERERAGKAAAINLLLRATREPLVAMLGGDVIVTPGALAKLLAVFADRSVGMAGARTIPTNRRKGVIGTSAHILWELHHELSLRHPKLGEAVAFRRMVQRIDRNTLVDEAVLENVMRLIGLQLKYVPSAIVHNHGPETYSDFIAQRTRIYIGHLNLVALTKYRVSSMSPLHGLQAAWRLWRKGERLRDIAIFLALELIARMRARLARTFHRRASDGIWKPISTSKRVLDTGYTLRTHHDAIQTIEVMLRYGESHRGGRRRQEAIEKLRRAVRAEDGLSVSGDVASIVFRSDENGIAALSARLRDVVGVDQGFRPERLAEI